GLRYDVYSFFEDPRSEPDQPERGGIPPEIRDQYLQLPLLDPRIPALAREMTAGQRSVRERARAIESHLQRDYGYTLELPKQTVPDPLAYFLFSRKKGHCEYFASAMAVMLRTVGIPSRLATGFQSGMYNPLSDLWVVRASDAHSWVEAWIPGYGWATFDPTPADPGGFALVDRVNLYID